MSRQEFENALWRLLGAIYFNMVVLVMAYRWMPEGLPLWLSCLGAAALLSQGKEQEK